MTATEIEKNKDVLTEADYINHIMAWTERAGDFVALCADVLSSTRAIVPEGTDETYTRIEPILALEEREEVRNIMLSAIREMHTAIISEKLTPKL